MRTPNWRATYAVLWREGDGPSRAGRLDLQPTGLHLEGGGASGRLFSLTLRLSDVTDVAMARPEMRLTDRPTIEIRRSKSRPLRVVSLEGLGATRDIFERLAELNSRPRLSKARPITRS
jgi:hypothetical protein